VRRAANLHCYREQFEPAVRRIDPATARRFGSADAAVCTLMDTRKFTLDHSTGARFARLKEVGRAERRFGDG